MSTKTEQLKPLVDYYRERVVSAEMERATLHARGELVKMRRVDGNLVQLRLSLAEAYLSLSMARRDEGDHQGAVDAARLYAEQEHLAKSMRDELARTEVTS